MDTPIDYTSYLVRLWRVNNSPVSDPALNWQAEVEHIQSGQHWKFETANELLIFLRKQIDRLEGTDQPGSLHTK